ncbi:F0F1-type ATP synthase epsilon subunit [Fontibacillus solani]|uniref:F0F1-type ATP synthase epsilon subunit n=1 Tax=Fontibacillus solani TaxID=1572857 RepID=A0A7W3SUV0_9BACL|nr:hypothetical protein [Fontibacillus solani]MBA9086363.1 F0F1-type ATP synthase epsilon subunit [Fontibacillus solani]
MNLLTPGVMQGLIGASGHMKTAGVSMGVYEIAKNKNDELTMNRAIGYTTDSLKSAAKSSAEAGKALKEAQIEANRKAKAEQEAALEESRRQKAAELKAESQARGDSSSADTIEISAEGRAVFNVEARSEIDVPVVAHTEKVVSEPKVYSPQGDIKIVPSEPNISISV